MKTIRHNTFETNSSSTHSITIDTANYPHKQIPKAIHIPYDDFGWESRKFNDFKTKASYFWTVAIYNEELRTRMEYLADFYGFSLQQEGKDSYYVDHGDEHYSGWIQDMPHLNTDRGLWSFLISESDWIITGNDNCVSDVNARLTDAAIAALPHEVVIYDASGIPVGSFKTKHGTLTENADAIGAQVEYLTQNIKFDGAYPNVQSYNAIGNEIIINYDSYDRHEKNWKNVHSVRYTALMF